MTHSTTQQVASTLTEWMHKCEPSDSRLRSIIKQKINQILPKQVCPRCGIYVPALNYDCSQCGWEFGFSNFNL